MPVAITCEHYGAKPSLIRFVKKTAELLLELCNCKGAELSILLNGDDRMANLNQTYRNKKGPTNVLSFCMDEDALPDGGPRLLGDVIISLETATREARQFGVSREQRLRFLLIHGLLHLLGYDHEGSAEEAKRMQAREEQLNEQLKKRERRRGMPHLAINVDHIATVRQARGTTEPDPVLAAALCELAGAQGIVVHLREDRRHIQDRDVRLLRQTVKTKLNLEMATAKEIIGIALEVKPDMVTFVPEKRQELTTEGGLNVSGQKKHLAAVIASMREAGIPVSLFVDPDVRQIKAALAVGATFVEIHTGRYADAITEEELEREFDLVASSAEEAAAMGLRVNAGHGLNYRNTSRIAALPMIEELSIGHAVMARAIVAGLENAVREMLSLMRSTY